MTNFHALRLNQQINNVVADLAKNNQVDLNTVDKLSASCIRIGLTLKTGKIILIT